MIAYNNHSNKIGNNPDDRNNYITNYILIINISKNSNNSNNNYNNGNNNNKIT